MKAELRALPLEALESGAFAPFGEVIEAGSAATGYTVNAGTAQRFHDLAHIDTDHAGGRSVLSLFRAMPRTVPFEIRMLERHCLGSQAFVPLDPATRFLVVVAEAYRCAAACLPCAGRAGRQLSSRHLAPPADRAGSAGRFSCH
jgi:ureidoglycolate hydrolase